MHSSGAGTSNKNPLQESGRLSSAILITLPKFNYRNQSLQPHLFNFFSSSSSTYIIPTSIIMSNISLDSTDSDVFYVEQISNEPSPRRNNSPDILNSTERSEHQAPRMPSISTIASPQPHIFTINDDSNEPTIPYGFGRKIPIVPPPA